MKKQMNEEVEDLVVDAFELVSEEVGDIAGGVFGQSTEPTVQGWDTCGSCTGQDTCVTLCGGGGGNETPLCW